MLMTPTSNPAKSPPRRSEDRRTVLGDVLYALNLGVKATFLVCLYLLRGMLLNWNGVAIVSLVLGAVVWTLVIPIELALVVATLVGAIVYGRAVYVLLPPVAALVVVGFYAVVPGFSDPSWDTAVIVTASLSAIVIAHRRVRQQRQSVDAVSDGAAAQSSRPYPSNRDTDA